MIVRGRSRAASLLAPAVLAAALGPAAEARAGASPGCVPARLNVSNRRAGGAVEVTPLPGSRSVSVQTQISFLGARAGTLSAVRVRGAASGVHAGRLRGYSQGDGLSFVPTARFTPGEAVTVSATVSTPSGPRAVRFGFTTAQEDRIPLNRSAVAPPAKHGQVQNFRTRPDLRPPTVGVLTPRGSPTPLDVFAAPYSGPGQMGPMLLDGAGRLIWFQPLPDGIEAADFRPQTYGSEPVLAWWAGAISDLGFGRGADYLLDTHYRPVAVIRGGDGVRADLHELQLTPERTAFITADHVIRCNLSAIGGPSDAAVSDSVAQEVDVATGLVRFEWHSLDHVALPETHMSARTASATNPLDYIHVNSIDPSLPGQLLLSARNTWGVYDIDRATGQIIWRLGGRNSSFQMGRGTTPAWQHDARWLPDGTISIFDNGAVPQVEPQSRAIVVRPDTTTATATLVRQYTHTPGLLSRSQGNVQSLLGGDVFVGWGAQPFFTEFDPSGKIVFDARMAGKSESYRAYEAPWVGQPLDRPRAVPKTDAHGAETVAVSWNGATRVVAWQLLTGEDRDHLVAGPTAPTQGFETKIAVPRRARFGDVVALDSGGKVLGSTHEFRL